MNCYVYGYGPEDAERLIVVDLGVTFPDMDGAPGVDLILPDISWLEERKAMIDAVFITHAHEDHVGAVGHTFEKLGAPIYARAFTANIARRKLEEFGVGPEAVTTVSRYPEAVETGPFKVSFVPVSHSIPESSGLLIETPAGRVFHTGDFKLDATPGVGEPFEPELFEEIAKGGIKALICDSTNVFSPHEGRSEASVGPEIEKLVSEAEGMVVATTFASNIARVKTLAEAGERSGRSICLLGRAMRRMVEAGVETGVLTDFPSTVTAEDALDIPRGNLMLLVTGSQGERRAASAQLANGKYRGLTMKEGDTFLFSSKTIPGNERGVIRIINAFSEMGVDVVDEHSGGHYHVSGHANRPDLERMHGLIDPAFVVPMHGEHRHLRAHVKLAEASGRTSALAVNGTMLDLAGNAPRVAGYVETGRTYLDGSVQVGAMDGVVRDRIRMALNGHVMVSVILEDDEPVGEPWCELMGLAETGTSNAPLADVLEEDLGQFLMRASAKTLKDDDKLEEELRRITRNTAQSEIGKKPEVTVVLSRLG
ncbi:MAG: ribonuclease J [Pseudomonadota bacterium]